MGHKSRKSCRYGTKTAAAEPAPWEELGMANEAEYALGVLCYAVQTIADTLAEQGREAGVTVLALTESINDYRHDRTGEGAWDQARRVVEGVFDRAERERAARDLLGGGER